MLNNQVQGRLEAAVAALAPTLIKLQNKIQHENKSIKSEINLIVSDFALFQSIRNFLHAPRVAELERLTELERRITPTCSSFKANKLPHARAQQK